MTARPSRRRAPRPRAAWLIGATGGLGPAIARALAADGWSLLLTSRSRVRENKALAAELRSAGATTEIANGAADDAVFCNKAVARARAAFGGLDAVVIAAGDLFLGAPSRTRPDDLRRQFESNVIAPWTAATAALAELRRSGRGRLIFFGMAGASSLTAKRRIAAHAAAKVALLSMARSLAAEVAAGGVVVSVVAPGVVRTRRSKSAAVDPFLHLVPGGRAVAPEEVARVVAWCAGDGNAAGTGAEIPVALGFGL